MPGLARSFPFVESPAPLAANSHAIGRLSAMRFACRFGNHTTVSGTLEAVAFSFC